MGGVQLRHSRSCATRHGGSVCDCEPGWRGWVYDRTTQKVARKTFRRKHEAEYWVAMSTGQQMPPNMFEVMFTIGPCEPNDCDRFVDRVCEQHCDQYGCDSAIVRYADIYDHWPTETPSTPRQETLRELTRLSEETPGGYR